LTSSSIPTTGGNNTGLLGTMVWTVKHTDFGKTALGKQRISFQNTNGSLFANCQPAYVDPPSLSTYNNNELARPITGYTPPPSLIYGDINISNNGQAVYICKDEGGLKQQVSNFSECTYNYIELRYQYMNGNEVPLSSSRNEVIPRELIQRIIRVNKGIYNGDAWWCENGDILTNKYCKSCGPQNFCRKLSFKM